MAKVKFNDTNVLREAAQIWTGVTTVTSVIFLFVEIPECWRVPSLIILAIVSVLIYLAVWLRANLLQNIVVRIDGTNVNVKVGDIFKEPELKVIAFNEYFDTIVDDEIIAEGSVNGIFITKHLNISVENLDNLLGSHRFEPADVRERNEARAVGKKQRYRLGTIVRYEEYLLTAFARFDEQNRATLTMPEYLEFLMNFWDQINKIYAGKSVAVTVFGSGITRIKGHKIIGDEELLKIMLWTFRLSEMRFKHPAKLTIVVHESKIDQIDLFEIAAVRRGL